MTRVLFVDGDPPPSDEIDFFRIRAGWAVDLANDADSAMESFRGNKPAVVFVEWELRPGSADGLALCSTFRAASPELGIIFVTRRSSIEDRLTAFDAGADDFVSKPWDARELVARSKVLIRRASLRPSDDAGPPSSALTIGSAGRLNLSGLVSGPGGHTQLTRTELNLVLCLRAIGRTGIDGDALAARAFSRRDGGARNLVHRHLCNVRSKLQQVGVGDALRRCGTGYTLFCGEEAARLASR